MPNASDFNHFSVNPVNVDISRSAFNMDHSVKWSCNVGEVIPFDVIEVLPGDTFEIDTSKVIRLQPLVAPIFDEVTVDVYWFFVPNRLVWSHWKEFMGENNESAWAPSVQYNIPTIEPPTVTFPDMTGSYTGWKVGTIADYMGIPPISSSFPRSMSGVGAKFSALPFRAYALICDQWFRSEAVMDPVHVHVDDSNRTGSNGSDQVTDIELGGAPFIACKYFDYFTSVLPSPQRGDPVNFAFVDRTSKPNLLPVVTKNYVDVDHPYHAGKNRGVHDATHMTFANLNQSFQNVSGQYPFNVEVNNVESDLVARGTDQTSGVSTYDLFFDNLFVDMSLTSFPSITINDLRTAFAVQKYLEKQARYGGRYIEFIKGFFGVDSPDARLQRTEYLGGSRISLNINQVEQTSATTTNTTPLGDVAGMSVTADYNSDFTKSFTEHGHIIGCAVARYSHSYQDSVHRLWRRKTPYEFYNPVFANLGEMPVYKDEMYGYFVNGTDVSKRVAFGYNEAWCEYRYLPSRIAGEFRSVADTPLDMWHLGDHYSSAPSLSPEWLREDKSNLDRCLAVTSDVSNQILCDFFVKTKAVRPMPMYSIPGLIDHH